VFASTEGVKKILTGLSTVPNWSSAKAETDASPKNREIKALLRIFMVTPNKEFSYL
jgi:hypothetical protein